MKFIDEVKIFLSSGHGGPGSISFRRESMTPRGGPDGGDGGKGGDVILQVANNLNSLVDYRANKKYYAQNGNAGEAKNCSGAGRTRFTHQPQHRWSGMATGGSVTGAWCCR